MLVPGDTLAGRYQLQEQVATGGVGQVWQARDTVLARTVAIKVLLSRSTEQPGFAARFLDEARTLAALDHPGVVGAYDFGEQDGAAYLVMAYVEGEPLQALMTSRGRLSAAETMAVVARVAHALDAVHRAGIVHRDVKPSNLILQEDGSVVLVDFGIAHQPRPTHLTAADEVIGTPLYIAPEQVSKQPITPATDVYALGSVAYHCLAGRPPFEGDNPIAVALQHLTEDPPPLPADVPASVRALVATAMAKDPAERFPSAAALAEAAQTWTTQPWTAPTLAAESATARLSRPTLLERTAAGPGPTSPVRTNRRGLAALSLGLLCLMMIVLAIQSGTLPTIPGQPSGPLPAPSGTHQREVPAGNGGANGPTLGASPGPSGTPDPSGGTTAPDDPTPPPVTVPAEPSNTGEPGSEPTAAPPPTRQPATGQPAPDRRPG